MAVDISLPDRALRRHAAPRLRGSPLTARDVSVAISWDVCQADIVVLKNAEFKCGSSNMVIRYVPGTQMPINRIGLGAATISINASLYLQLP